MVEVGTIGAYGWNVDSFFDALVRERIGVFCDLRRRRGVRGSEYSFVNSVRLQKRLSELGIDYRHRLDLSPSPAVREMQTAADRSTGIAKRDRSQLGSAFEKAFVEECLVEFDAVRFLAELGGRGPICLFCVEREPAACHRSLVAERLARSGAITKDLLP
jgi:Protein of unknown function, DUF488